MANRKVEEKTPSAAQALVQLAAYRIDLSPRHLQVVVDKLDEEFVTELWQLSFLDSINWKDLGAPIGLVAAIRACLQEKEESNEILDTLLSSSTTSIQLDQRYSEITTSEFNTRASEYSISSSSSNNNNDNNNNNLRRGTLVRKRSSEIPKASRPMGDLPPQSAHRRLSDTTEMSYSTGATTLPSPMPTVRERIVVPPGGGIDRRGISNEEQGGEGTIRRGSNEGNPVQPIRRQTRIMDESYLRALDLSDSNVEDDVEKEEEEEVAPVVSDLPDKPKRRSTIKEDEEGEEELIG